LPTVFLELREQNKTANEIRSKAGFNIETSETGRTHMANLRILDITRYFMTKFNCKLKIYRDKINIHRFSDTNNTDLNSYIFISALSTTLQKLQQNLRRYFLRGNVLNVET
jgi:hypothetical protein